MNTPARRPRVVLAVLIAIGLGLLAIPLFLTPPAFLDFTLRDSAFGADLAARRLSITDGATGTAVHAALQKTGDRFLARIGRIDSGTAAFTLRVDGYAPHVARVRAEPLQRLRIPVDLTPTFGRLQLTPVNAIRMDEPVVVTLTKGQQTISQSTGPTVTLDLPPGTHVLAARAPGFCAAERSFDVRAGQTTTATFPVSPDLQGDEIARFVLHWETRPNDLDAMFLKLGTSGWPNPDLVFYRQKEARRSDGVYARLDVDMRRPRGYETLTVRNNLPAEFLYYVLQISRADGTIGRSGAAVQLYLPGCRVRTFHPPQDCGELAWAVTHVRRENGVVTFDDQNRCVVPIPTLPSKEL